MGCPKYCKHCCVSVFFFFFKEQVSVKTESDSFERWTASCRLEDTSESLPEADSATAAQSPEREPEVSQIK